MAVTREFIDWNEPILPAAADFLIDRYAQDQSLDLTNVLAVVPGRRAGRLLLEILVERAETANIALSPPTIETIGKLPESLYKSRKPFATTLVQRLAWAQSIRSLDTSQLQKVMRRPPDFVDLPQWLEIGDLLRRQHVELMGDCLDFKDVRDHVADSQPFVEQQRWEVLAELQDDYLARLNGIGMWDKQTARSVAVKDGECQSERDIVLVATADINRIIGEMLSQVSDRVTALVHAPESRADHFNALGCLDPEVWENETVPLDDRQIRLAGDPTDQATVVANVLAGYGGRYRPDEITIGVPEKGLIAQLQRRLHQNGASTHSGPGRELASTRPFRLLEAIADFLENDRFHPFASLVRQADVFAWIQRHELADGALTELDNYYNNHLPTRLKTWLGAQNECQTIQAIYKRLDDLLKPLRGATRPLADWSPGISELMAEIYEGSSLQEDVAEDSHTIAACRKIADALNELRDVPENLELKLTASKTIRLVLDSLQTETVPHQADDDAVELLGWLDLPTDTAPALVVTSVNEGVVPSSHGADLFLPETLRRELKLLDNQRRYARDVYAMSVLVAAREDLTLIVGRRNGSGDPLVPSRILLTGDDELLVRRALRLFVEKEAPTSPARVRDVSTAASVAFDVPRPIKQPEPLQRMSVTAFRDYLACPYRFYLRHVLKLETVDDSAGEIGPAMFGILIHEAAQGFSESPARDSENETEIRERLFAALDEAAYRAFGGEQLPAVKFQLQQCQARLAALAEWQAQRYADGWRIEMAEQKIEPFELQVDKRRSIVISGRIDRIDRNVHSGDWEVLDYKTSTKARPPDSVHRNSAGEWTDLQLPLYRRLAAGMGITGPMRLGYIVLPKDVADVGRLLGDWDEDQLASADQVAVEVARNVLDQNFWPPAKAPSQLFSDYATICQENVFGRTSLDAEDGP